MACDTEKFSVVQTAMPRDASSSTNGRADRMDGVFTEMFSAQEAYRSPWAIILSVSLQMDGSNCPSAYPFSPSVFSYTSLKRPAAYCVTIFGGASPGARGGRILGPYHRTKKMRNKGKCGKIWAWISK